MLSKYGFMHSESKRSYRKFMVFFLVPLDILPLLRSF